MVRIDIKEKELQLLARIGLFSLLRSLWSFSAHHEWTMISGIKRPSIDSKRIFWTIQTGKDSRSDARKWDKASQIEAFLDDIVPDSIMTQLTIIPKLELKFKTGNKSQYRAGFKLNPYKPSNGITLKEYITNTTEYFVHPKDKTPFAVNFEAWRKATAEAIALQSV